MSLRAYGPVAEALSDRLDPQLPLIVADPDGAAEALHEAVRRRRRGEPFAVAPLVDDRRVDLANSIVPQLFATEPDYERRRGTLLALAAERLTINGQPQAAIRTLDDRVRTALRDLTLCADAVALPSRRAHVRLQTILGLGHRAPVVGVAPVMPRPGPVSGGNRIVIWGPNLSAPALFAHAFAFHDAVTPVTVVCADPAAGRAAGLRARWIDAREFAADPAPVGAVVVGDPRDPSEALALAGWNIPLAVARTSGADEYFTGAPTYDPLDIQSILFAGQHALAGGPALGGPALDLTAAIAAGLAATAPPLFGPEAPLVTSITSTKNRPAYVARLLVALRAQTYPNVEIIVVNDGGVPIDHLFADLPGVVHVVNETSIGAMRASALATARARGAYVTYISDDDVVYPDHLARCVTALERTGAALARSLMVTTLQEPAGERYVVAGHAVYTPLGIDPWDQAASYSLGSVGLVWRTSMVRESLIDARFGSISDWAQYLQVAPNYEILALDAVTREQDLRLDGSQVETSQPPAVAAEERRVLFAAYARPDRPALEASRAALVAAVEAGPGGGIPPLPAPLPSRPDAGVGPRDLRG